MEYVSSYQGLWRQANLKKRKLHGKGLRCCSLCGHECGVDRLSARPGYARADDTVLISSWGPHFGEEPPLVGRCGSGVFFTGCNLKCVFCQNWDISQMGMGRQISTDELGKIMASLQKAGCHNINLVTPTHCVPQILAALIAACDKGLSIPLVYNCGGYESVETLKILDGIVDIYMPDVKYARREHALRYSGAKDYPKVAKAALREMHRQVGDLVIDKNGIARRGLLVRHLVLPGGLAGTAEIMEFIAKEISQDTYINIMAQYDLNTVPEYPPLN